MRTLILVPIIHTSADLGSLAKVVTKRGIADLGEEFWRKHEKTIEGFWNVIEKYFGSLEVSGFKIYQDGMVAEGEIGQKIVEEGIKLGSKNYEMILKFLQKGAILVKTEDFNLVKEERDRLLKITGAKTNLWKLLYYIKYRLTKRILLNKRDKFITKRIDETLKQNETGILFIGAYHKIKKRLPKDIEIIEIKNTDKIREYQRLLPFHSKNKELFEELDRYLVSEISPKHYPKFPNPLFPP